MVEFLKQNWEGIVATVALVQVWVIMFYERYIRKASLDIYPSGVPEIGYSEFGPTIAIYGALRAKREDVFVKRIRVRIRRVRTNEEHWFVWIAFRSPAIFPISQTSAPLELPNGFIVSQTQPHRYNIVFHDPDIQRNIRQVLQDLPPLLNTPRDVLLFAKGSANWNDILDRNFREYQSSPEHLRAFDVVSRQCYWQADQYELEIHVDTEQGDSQFSRRMGLRLTEGDVERLRLNSTIMIDNPFRVIAGEEAWPFNFVYPEIKEP